MAQPNRPPPSTGQKILEFILDRDKYGLQNSLLGNLNLLDYMNLRRQTQRILHSLDPIVLQTQNLHNPPAPNRKDPNDFLQLKLGAQCDDMRKIYNVPAAQQRIPCPNGPTTRVTMRPCRQTDPQSHPPFPTRCFNVCNDCLHSWSNYYHRKITNGLPSRRSILCKRCSLRLRRRHRPGHSACTCRRAIFADAKCHTCRLETELATYAAGDARRRTLERTHVRRAGPGGRRRRVLHVDHRPDTVRARAACATPGCGREAWTKHSSRRLPGQNEPGFSRHLDACLMCLCCSGEIVP